MKSDAAVHAQPIASSPNCGYPAGILLSRLKEIAGEFRNVAFASSLGAEDMLIADAIFTAGVPDPLLSPRNRRPPPGTVGLPGRLRGRYSPGGVKFPARKRESWWV